MSACDLPCVDLNLRLQDPNPKLRQLYHTATAGSFLLKVSQISPSQQHPYSWFKAGPLSMVIHPTRTSSLSSWIHVSPLCWCELWKQCHSYACCSASVFQCGTSALFKKHSWVLNQQSYWKEPWSLSLCWMEEGKLLCRFSVLLWINIILFL